MVKVVRNSVSIISHITFRDCRVHNFPTTFLEIAVHVHGVFELIRMVMRKNANNDVSKDSHIGFWIPGCGLRIPCKYWGTYHLHGKTGSSGWKVKWLAPFSLGSFIKDGL